MKIIIKQQLFMAVIISLLFSHVYYQAADKLTETDKTKAFPYTLKETNEAKASYKIEDYNFTDFDLTTKQGLQAAQLKAGDLEAGGVEIEQNLKKALYWYKKAANSGSVEAMHRLGDYHQFGVGNKNSRADKALMWYTKAANKGYLPSITNLAAIAIHNENYNDSRMWLNAAIKNGDVKSLLILADHYFLGLKPFPKDLVKAIDYYRQAAEKGQTIAQLRYGILLAGGKNADKDPVLSYKWISLAAQNGNKAASKYLQETLKPQLSSEQIVAAEKMITAYNKTIDKKAAEDVLTTYQPPDFTLEGFKKDFLAMEVQNINTSKPLVWIFYFTGYTDQSLVQSAVDLEKQGFKPIGTYTDKTVGFYWLEVEQKYLHTPETLLEQVNKFQSYVKEKGLRSFEKLDLRYNKSNG